MFDVKTASGIVENVRIPLKKLKRADWFDYCQQCVMAGNSKETRILLYLYVQEQIAQFEGEQMQIERVQRVGWCRKDDGGCYYECGNCCIGGDDDSADRSAISHFRLDYFQDDARQKEAIDTYIDLLRDAPGEAVILLDYFFTGLMRSVYRQAEIPVDFVVYLLGKQQGRKTTIARLTNNLYCRSDNMDFAVRSLPEMSKSDIIHFLSEFNDATVVLDDVALTASKSKKRQQEELLEYVVRMIGNHTQQSKCYGNIVKEFDMNTNVVFTGEYMPKMAESALSRMLIVKLEGPVPRDWLNKFQNEPAMLSTVAYCFLQWVREHYQEVGDISKNNFKTYRADRAKHLEHQERIQGHAFILQNTNYLVSRFLSESAGKIDSIQALQGQHTEILKEALARQVELMDIYKIKAEEQNFCNIFACLYMNREIEIAEDHEDYDKKDDDGFIRDGCICIESAKILAIMREEYKDESITVQSITKQFRANRFLRVESGKNEKSSKKVDGQRFLFIDQHVVKAYAKYNLRRVEQS